MAQRRLGGLDLTLLEALFEPQHEGPMFVKDAALRYVAANEAMLRLCGVSRRADLFGRRAEAFFGRPLAEHYEALDRRVLESGEPCLDRLDLSIDAQPAPTWLLFSRLPVQDETGCTVGVAATARQLGRPDPRHPTYARLSAVVERLQLDLAAPLDLNDLARLAGVSPSQLERDFANTFRTTPRGFLHRLRIEQAVQALRRGTPVARVAQECGYSDHSAFARRFRRVTGLTPTAFRTAPRSAAREKAQ